MKKLTLIAVIATLAAGALAQTVYYPDSARYIGDQEIKEAIGTVESNVVNTVNGEAGAIVIEAGDNVTITKTNGTINVAATDNDTVFNPADIGITVSEGSITAITVDDGAGNGESLTADASGNLKWGDSTVAMTSDIPTIDANTVTNINGITGGTVTIEAGDNVAITQTNGVINIAATDTDTVFDPANIGITVSDDDITAIAINGTELSKDNSGNLTWDGSVVAMAGDIPSAPTLADLNDENQLATELAAYGISVDSTDNDNIAAITLGTNVLDYSSNKLQWNNADVAMISDIPAAVDPAVLEHDVSTTKTEADASGSPATLALSASDKNEVWVKWSEEDKDAAASVTISLPSITSAKVGTLTVYVDEIYVNEASAPVSQVYKFANNAATGLPSAKPWESNAASKKSLWKFEFENIPGSTSWYFIKATEFIITAVE